MAELILKGRPIVQGAAAGPALISPEPLSFWGGYDFQSGEIMDRRHPLSGQIAAGCMLGIPFSRGSSTTTAVLLEAIKAGAAPAAILTTGPDAFFALAAIVAWEMYAYRLPILALYPEDYVRLKTDDWIEITADGLVQVNRQGE